MTELSGRRSSVDHHAARSRSWGTLALVVGAVGLVACSSSHGGRADGTPAGGGEDAAALFDAKAPPMNDGGAGGDVRPSTDPRADGASGSAADGALVADARGKVDDAGRTGDSRGADGSGGKADGGGTGTYRRSLTIESGTPWYTTSGKLLNAHGAGVIKVDESYYLIGEYRIDKHYELSFAKGQWETVFVGFACYSSTDLVNWKDEGIALAVTPGTDVDGKSTGERPKILFNKSTNTYVMFFHAWAHQTAAYATSSSVCSGYKYQGNVLYNGRTIGAGDVGAFQDDDGTGYLMMAQGVIYKLSPDYTRAVSKAATVPMNGSVESPAMFKSNGTYYYLASYTNWWHSTNNAYATAPTVTGPWTHKGRFAPGGTNTWDSQTTFVLPIVGSEQTTFMYMGDRWCNGCLPSSSYVWQPLVLQDGGISLGTFRPIWTIDTETGVWKDAPDDGTTVNDATKGTGPNQVAYTGSWQTSSCTNLSRKCHGDDRTVSSTAGDTAKVKFTGTQARLYVLADTNGGLAGVSLCDADEENCGTEALIPLFADYREGNRLGWTSPLMPKATYVLKVRVTGNKPAYSEGTAVAIDRVTIATD
jgi:hypothetical protein